MIDLRVPTGPKAFLKDIMSDKIFKTYRQQIKILRSRQMKISKGSKILKILKYENYYRVVNGYKEILLINQSPEQYIKNATFEELYSVFLFDRNLRILFLKYLLKVEHYVKSVISYEFSKHYGFDNYLKISNFDTTRINDITRLFKSIQNKIYLNTGKHQSIVHYLNTYGYIPLWVLSSVLTLGDVSLFYSVLKQNDQNSIARQFNINSDEFRKYLINLTIARNICAHDDKFYNLITKRGIRHDLISKIQILNIPYINNQPKYGTNDVYSIAIILSLILEKKDVNEFATNINKEINRLKRKLKSINISKIIDKIGTEDFSALINLK